MSDLGNNEVFAENLQRLMDLHHKDRNDLVRDLDLKYTTIANWLQGKRYPRIGKIEQLARYFNVNKTELVERYTPPAPAKSNELSQAEERQIDLDLEDMMHSISSAAYEGNTDAEEDVEALKATLRAAMIQAKKIAKKKYTPRKYR